MKRYSIVRSFAVNMASTSNGNTPTAPEEVGKPPEGVVLPPKDIRGPFFVPSLRSRFAP